MLSETCVPFLSSDEREFVFVVCVLLNQFPAPEHFLELVQSADNFFELIIVSGLVLSETVAVHVFATAATLFLETSLGVHRVVPELFQLFLKLLDRPGQFTDFVRGVIRLGGWQRFHGLDLLIQSIAHLVQPFELISMVLDVIGVVLSHYTQIASFLLQDGELVPDFIEDGLLVPITGCPLLASPLFADCIEVITLIGLSFLQRQNLFLQVVDQLLQFVELAGQNVDVIPIFVHFTVHRIDARRHQSSRRRSRGLTDCCICLIAAVCPHLRDFIFDIQDFLVQQIDIPQVVLDAGLVLCGFDLQPLDQFLQLLQVYVFRLACIAIVPVSSITLIGIFIRFVLQFLQFMFVLIVSVFIIFVLL